MIITLRKYYTPYMPLQITNIFTPQQDQIGKKIFFWENGFRIDVPSTSVTIRMADGDTSSKSNIKNSVSSIESASIIGFISIYGTL